MEMVAVVVVALAATTAAATTHHILKINPARTGGPTIKYYFQTKHLFPNFLLPSIII